MKTMLRKPLHKATDNELVTLTQQGDHAAGDMLTARYRGLIAQHVGRYFIAGADQDDVLAEALVGFTRAIHDFQPNRGSSFKNFALKCCERSVISAIKTANRHKHSPLNDSRSLSEPVQDTPNPVNALTLEETLGANNTETKVVDLDRYRALRNGIRDQLSRVEQTVIVGRLVGAEYLELAEAVGRPGDRKRVDNLIQRSQRKLKHLIEEGGEAA